MKTSTGHRAGTRHIAGILGNFGFHHNNIERGQKESFLSISNLRSMEKAVGEICKMGGKVMKKAGMLKPGKFLSGDLPFELLIILGKTGRWIKRMQGAMKAVAGIGLTVAAGTAVAAMVRHMDRGSKKRMKRSASRALQAMGQLLGDAEKAMIG